MKRYSNLEMLILILVWTILGVVWGYILVKGGDREYVKTTVTCLIGPHKTVFNNVRGVDYEEGNTVMHLRDGARATLTGGTCLIIEEY